MGVLLDLTFQCGGITWRAQLKTVWPLVESTSFNARKISLQNRKAKWPQNSAVFIPDLVFIGPESDHWLCLSVTHSLTAVQKNLIDVTLACEDAYSKLVEVVTVIDVDDENRVSNSLQIWKLRFVQTFSTRVGQEFEVEVQARF